MSSQTGPGRPLSISRRARSRWWRIIAGSSRVTAYLVMERTMGTMSTSCTPPWRRGRPLSRSARLTWPEMKNSGNDSIHAPATGVMALVAPGPVVTMQVPNVPRTRPQASAAMPQACSWWQGTGIRRFSQTRASLRCMAPPPGRRNTCSAPVSASRDIK